MLNCALHLFAGIGDQYQLGIFRILASILHFGNVEIKSRDADSCTISVSVFYFLCMRVPYAIFPNVVDLPNIRTFSTY